MAKAGPRPMRAGSRPAAVNPRMRPMTLSPSALAFSSLARMRQQAPSVIWEALPAVTVP